MNYKSTRSDGNFVKSTHAVLEGLAPDGGLYMPAGLDFSAFDASSLMKLSAREMSEKILSFFLDDFENMKELVENAYRNKFADPELVPVKKVGDRFVLELFHGPTSAFKDVALSVLPYLTVQAKKQEGLKEKIVILTATSGDTGKAALEGFHDVPGIQIIVFFPDGGVSPVQKLQMVTQEGNNVCSTAVRGNFDDAQTGVKQIFSRVSAEGMPEGKHAVLSSANSINIGRLVPQIMYYFKAYKDLVDAGEISFGEPVDFTVPTGNFGDILAGYFAKRMNLPVNRLICASNENNVLTDFIETGVYDKNREFYKTVSPSMDILVSSNLERLLYVLSGEDSSYVAELMKKLSETGVYTVKPEILSVLKSEFSCGFADDEETKRTIAGVWKDNGYLMDTHTAVGWAVAEAYRKAHPEDQAKMIVLSTASPYKFPQAVSEAIGLPAEADEFRLMEKLSQSTGTNAPVQLATLQKKPVRFTDVIDKERMYEYVMSQITD